MNDDFLRALKSIVRRHRKERKTMLKYQDRTLRGLLRKQSYNRKMQGIKHQREMDALMNRIVEDDPK